MPVIAIALVIAAALGGGTATLAQQSLPGDPLWGFKVSVNEGLTGALSASDIAKADWDLSAIQTRLAEAQALSSKGKLTANAQAAIAANVQSHAAGVTSIVARLQQGGDMQDAADIAARYQATLAGASSTQPGTLASTVHAELDQASGLSASASASVH